MMGDWIQLYDHKYQSPYYYNRVTGEASWEYPISAAHAPVTSPAENREVNKPVKQTPAENLSSIASPAKSIKSASKNSKTPSKLQQPTVSDSDSDDNVITNKQLVSDDSDNENNNQTRGKQTTKPPRRGKQNKYDKNENAINGLMNEDHEDGYYSAKSRSSITSSHKSAVDDGKQFRKMKSGLSRHDSNSELSRISKVKSNSESSLSRKNISKKEPSSRQMQKMQSFSNVPVTGRSHRNFENDDEENDHSDIEDDDDYFDEEDEYDDDDDDGNREYIDENGNIVKGSAMKRNSAGRSRPRSKSRTKDRHKAKSINEDDDLTDDSYDYSDLREHKKHDYFEYAASYKLTRPYMDRYKKIMCVLCLRNECLDFLFPCEHRCICRSCIVKQNFAEYKSEHTKDMTISMKLLENHKPSVSYSSNCPLCGTIIQRILENERGREVDKYWEWVHAIRNPPPDQFMARFKHTEGMIETVFLDGQHSDAKKASPHSNICIIS